jgi:hypothetical protein
VLHRRTSTRLGSVVAVLAVAAIALAACATPGYSPKRIESELVQAGATPAQARCVADALPDSIDLNALGSHFIDEFDFLDRPAHDCRVVATAIVHYSHDGIAGRVPVDPHRLEHVRRHASAAAAALSSLIV